MQFLKTESGINETLRFGSIFENGQASLRFLKTISLRTSFCKANVSVLFSEALPLRQKIRYHAIFEIIHFSRPFKQIIVYTPKPLSFGESLCLLYTSWKSSFRPNSRQRTFFSPFLNNRPVPRNSSIRPFRCALAKALFSESFENHPFMSTFQKRCTWNNFTKSMQFVSLFQNGLHSFFGQAVPLGSGWVKYYKSVQFTKTYQLTWTVHFLSTNF